MSSTQAIVIGSGPGGSAIAWSLATAGIKVRILEAGPRYDPHKDYRLGQNDWERHGFPAKISTRGRQTHAPLQELDERWDHLRSWNHLLGRARKGTSRRSFLDYSHVVGVGGSTLHYAGESHRMHPQSMRMRSRFGVAADWPFDYDELEPWYLQAERLIGVAGPSDDPTRPRSADYPMPPHAMSYASRVLGEDFGKLGMSWIPNPVAANSQI